MQKKKNYIIHDYEMVNNDTTLVTSVVYPNNKNKRK